MADRPSPEPGSSTRWAACVLPLLLALGGLGVVAPPLPAFAAAPAGLAVVATADRTTVTRPGEKVTDTFVVRNRGDVALLDLLVSTTTPGTTAPVCSPVPLGGSLAAGATTTCRAGRTVTLLDLGRASLDDTAVVRVRTASGTRVSATGSVTVTTAAPPPDVTDQRAFVVRYGAPFVFRGSSTATPAEPGGPAIDQARTVFVDNGGGVYYSGKGTTSTEGFWQIRPDGTVELDPKGAEPDATTGSVAYRVYDVLGHSATANLTATVRAQPQDVGAGASTPQNQPVTIDVLAPEDAGQNVDGTRAAFVPGSVRLLPIDADKHRGYATLSADGKRLTVPYEGEYAVRSDGRVTFDPVPAFSGSAATPDFTVDTTSGNPLTGRFGVDVVPVAPRASDESVATAYGRPATFAAASGASPGDPTAPIVPSATVLIAPGATAGGRTYVVGAGTWQVQASGAVTFTPRVGYAGTTTTTYAAVDRNGTRTGHQLTVTVRSGAATVPLTATTPRGTGVTLDPLAGATAGQRLDGSTAALDPTSVTFPAAGQPAGAVLTAGRTLTVPGQGTWTADATSGRVTFGPDAAFAGATAPVAYRAVDDAGNVATGRLVVVVTSDVPVATDDLVATPLGTRVRLPAGTDDRPGAVPLQLAGTVFAVDGQPAGSTRSADGRTLVVSGQGTWTLAADGSAAFVPTPAYVGTTAPVAYQVVDARGATARATLRVLVRPGPSASPDSAARTASDNYVTLHALENDVPGRNADGTLGTLDPASLRFSGDGLPKGWTLTDDGSQASNGKGLYGFIDQLNGWVGFTRDRGVQGLAGPIRYSVRDTVRDATGAVVHHTVSAAAQVDFTGVPGHATDDEATTTDQSFARLAGMTNDVPPGPRMAWSKTEVTFPIDQLDQLPPGTKIDNPPDHGSVMTVPGEGTWASHDADGTVTFAPAATFLGRTTPVTYEVRDGDLADARATLRVTVVPGARVAPDSVSTAQNVTVRVDVSADDQTGPAVAGSRVEWDPDAVNLSDVGLPSGSHLSADYRRLWVPGQGTYAVQALSSIVSFDPVPGFTGDTTPVRVGVRAVVQPGNEIVAELSAPLRVHVTRVLPVARADAATTAPGRPVVVPVLANDRPGDGRVPLVGGSVRLRLAPGLPAGTTLSGDAKTLTVPGHGVFLVAGDGSVTFVPLGGAVGVVPTVGYQVADTNASTARATLAVTVR